MQKGIINEINFVHLLNKKIVKNVPTEMQSLLFHIYKDIDLNSKIECWQSKYIEKADIKIRINKEIKGISIKSSPFSSMHQEPTEKFYKFLMKIGVEQNVIKMFDSFILGEIEGKRVSAKEYVEKKKNDIYNICKAFNEYYVKTNLLIRFIFQGSELQNYGCDAIILGTPNNFMWATKSELLKYLIEMDNKNYKYTKVSLLNIKSYDRNLRNNVNKKNDKAEIQIKWYSMKQDLEYLTIIRKAEELKDNIENINYKLTI